MVQTRQAESTCIDEDALLAFTSGALVGAARALVVNHIRDCSECRAVVAELSREASSGEETTRSGPAVPRAAPSKRDPRSFEDGQVVEGRYEVLRFVARGGMGEVYEVFDRSLCQHLALKTLRGDYCDDKEAVERLKREVRLMRKVSHPSICRIGDFGVSHGKDAVLPFYTMEFVEGQTLSQRIKSHGPMTLDECIAIARPIAAAIDAIHAADVIHRDIKAGNVMLEKSGRVVVTDFGLATVVLSEMTLTGAGFLGSPLYVSPEQARGTKTTFATDVYSFGVLLYHMLSGTFPFVADTPLATVTMRLTEAPRPLSEVAPSLPEGVVATVRRCLAVGPDDRFATCGEFVRALDDSRTLSLVSSSEVDLDRRESRASVDSTVDPLLVTHGVSVRSTGSQQTESVAARRRRPLVVGAAVLAALLVVAATATSVRTLQTSRAVLAAPTSPNRLAFIEFRKSAGSDPLVAEATYESIRKLEYAKLVKVLEHTAEIRSLSQVEWVDLAVALMFVGAEQRSIAAANHALGMAPTSVSVTEYAAAVVDDVNGRNGAAKEGYARLWAKHTENSELGYLLTRSEYRASANRDAQSTLLELTRRSAPELAARIAELEALSASRQDPEGTELVANRLLDVAKQTGALRLEARAHRLQAWVTTMRGDFESSRRLYDQAAATYRRCSEPIVASEITNEIAVLEMEQGKVDDAILLYEDVLATKRAVGNTRGMVSVLNNLGSAHSHVGKLNASERYYRQSLAIAELHGIREPQGATLYNLGDLMLMHEDLRSASLAFNRALDMAVKTQEHMFEVFALEGKFLVSFMRADFEQAEDFLTQAARAADVNKVVSRQGAIIQHRAQLSYSRGEPRTSNELCDVVVPRARESHEENRLLGGLPLCAMTAALAGDLPVARRLVDEARVVTRHLAPTNVRRASIARADAFTSLLAHDYSRCVSVVADAAKGTEREALLGPSADLRMMAALARDAMHDSATAKLELGAAALSASRSGDPRSKLRVRAASALIAKERSRFDEVLQECSRAGLGGLADELRALSKAREAGAVPFSSSDR